MYPVTPWPLMARIRQNAQYDLLCHNANATDAAHKAGDGGPAATHRHARPHPSDPLLARGPEATGS
jgi:hypothetical protein